ncbi:MAG: methyltransferase domain-containing protein [Streptosporangiaceae bacterium]|jgi:ubiquinone/menaquinone biosynthesis C-methylase UbiE
MVTVYGDASGLASPHDDNSGDMGYWASHQYEHMAEVMAISRLLRGRQFGHAVDVGGGYGRLSMVLRDYADRVTLTDPSLLQVERAQQFLRGRSGVEIRLMDAAHLDFDDDSVDLAVLVRVLRHLPDPAGELAEIARILRPGGCAIIEAANVLHAVTRHRYSRSSHAITESPATVRSRPGKHAGGTAFVSHHPERLMLQLAMCGLQVERMLSVSSLRRLWRHKPGRVLRAAENALQVSLAPMYLGPSLFFLARKQDLAGSHESLALEAGCR